MEKNKIVFKNIPVRVNWSKFKGISGAEEYFFAFIPETLEKFEVQLNWIQKAYSETLNLLKLEKETAVFRRFFCSDLYNQRKYLEEFEISNSYNNSNPTSISFINQPPSFPARVSLLAYHINDRKVEKFFENNTLSLKRNGLIHNWTTGIIFTETESVYQQARKVIEKYIEILNKKNMCLSENVIRTWFFIQNIDTNYKEFVNSRREIYAENGLTEKTHYIASTGVEGSYYDLRAKVLLDAYSIYGIEEEQIKFLSAPEYLSPTYIYGVTFERGVSISYFDRKHIFISGTASINNKGEILYPGNIELQIERTLTNIEALLKNENAKLEDIMIFTVYVRDSFDFYIVESKLRKRFGETPMIIANANVCRPGWLVEIEGIGIIPSFNPELPPF
jgi:enamine deaminase RidA (YjgF/YER057c/UK114 family)